LNGIAGGRTEAALLLAPLPGGPGGPERDDWERLLPPAVALVDPGEGGGDGAPLVLLGRGGLDPAAELARRGGPLPLALLTYGPARSQAGTDFAVIGLGPAEDPGALGAPLAHELGRLLELSRAAREFVDSDLLDGQDSGVSATTPLLELGIVDSISIVALVAFVEDDLGIPVPEEEVHPRHLADVLSVERLIVKLDAAWRHGPRR
jgi:acyl carrier protein